LDEPLSRKGSELFKVAEECIEYAFQLPGRVIVLMDVWCTLRRIAEIELPLGLDVEGLKAMQPVRRHGLVVLTQRLLPEPPRNRIGKKTGEPSTL
jgi:hypothetical protein